MIVEVPLEVIVTLDIGDTPAPWLTTAPLRGAAVVAAFEQYLACLHEVAQREIDEEATLLGCALLQIRVTSSLRDGAGGVA